jgi:hypothetical protein
VRQEGLQYDLMSDGEESFFAEVFPDGLPLRSPVGCAGITGLAGATNQTMAQRRAAGDGTWGRRDFLWSGGQELSFNYEKRNVFGFALDFAEDVTKTSWGVETSWINNRFLSNGRRFGGLSQHDVITTSISVDRPTFFNFLNPNRSFFLNFQFFIQYIFDYDGGSRQRDGNYAQANHPFSVPIVTFTFFTGYFQDRLSPRMTTVYSPDTQTAGILWGLSYRWSGNFTTSLAANQFWGDPNSIQNSFFPAVARGNIETQSGSNRGLAAVTNRDTVFLNVRYSW